MRAKLALVAGIILAAVPAANAWQPHSGGQAGIALSVFHNKSAPVMSYGNPGASYYYPAASYYAPAAYAPAASYYPAAAPAAYAPAAYAPAASYHPAAAPAAYASPGYSCSGGAAGFYYAPQSYYAAPAAAAAPSYGEPQQALGIGSLLTALDAIDRIVQWVERRRGDTTSDTGGKAGDLQKAVEAANKKLDELKGITSLPEDVRQLRRDLDALEINVKKDTRESIKKALDDLKGEYPNVFKKP